MQRSPVTRNDVSDATPKTSSRSRRSGRSWGRLSCRREQLLLKPLRAVGPGQPGHGIRTRVLVLLIKRHPFFDRAGEAARIVALEVIRMLPGDFTEYRDIAREDRQPMLSRLDQRQAETFAQ